MIRLTSARQWWALNALLIDNADLVLGTHHSAYRVINGGVPEVTYLLKLKWDHSA